MNSKQEVLSNIQMLDNEIGKINLSCDLLIIGGASLLLLDIYSNFTYDIDAYKLVNKRIDGLNEPLEIIAHEYEINNQAFNDLPLLTLLINKSMENLEYVKIETDLFININLFVLPIEIIILSKVLAFSNRKMEKDVEDINILKKQEYDSEILNNHFSIWTKEISKNSQDSNQFSISEFINAFEKFF